MKRRNFLNLLAGTTAASMIGLESHAAASSFVAIREIKKLRITKGPMAGAFIVAPLGMVHWYFANSGLYPFVIGLRNEVRAYLDLYIQRMDPTKSYIADVLLDYSVDPTSPSIAGTLPQDSDDAYAATFLSLAARYDALFNDSIWWNANVANLKNIAYRNLAFCQKPSGLIRVFQDQTVSNNDAGYLMDNCQAFRALRDFAARLAVRNDPDANYYNTVAAGVGIGIKGLYHPTQKAFRVSDLHTSVGMDFYPDATAQVFPQAYGVTSSGLGAVQYTNAYAYLNSSKPGWETGDYHIFPWMILGFVAARRGGIEQDKARTQILTLQNVFATNRANVNIEELGFYKRTASVLGLPA